MRGQPSPGPGHDPSAAAAGSGRLDRRDRTDRLIGIERLVVDGTNVIHALGDERGPLPPAALIGRLRTVVPAGVAIDLVFDGPPAPGLGRRIGPGLLVHHAADRPADDLIVGLVVEAARRAPHQPGEGGPGGRRGPGSRLGPTGRPRVLVVTDDVELGRRVRRHGAATAPVRWLLARLARPKLAAPAAGRRRPPPQPTATVPPRPVEPEMEPPDREPWRPGRGATKKRGNPRRRPRRAD